MKLTVLSFCLALGCFLPTAARAFPYPNDLLFAPTGGSAGDELGSKVGSAGDMNGDGFDDVVAARGFSAYVYYGGPGADENPDLTTGFPAETAGDVNGDGLTDTITGWTDGGGGNGSATIHYGGGGSLTLTGEALNDDFGWSVGTAGDVNDDGFSDVIVGAPFNSAGGIQAGRAYVFYGGPGMDTVPDLTFTGQFGNNLGISVGTAGDVNGDRVADVIVGAPQVAGYGRAYIYYGGPGADSVADITLAGGQGGGGVQFFGFSVSTAGDVNGDHIADVIVGEPFYDSGGADAGRAYVFVRPDLSTAPDLIFTGEAAGDQFGTSVGAAGDVNGDGFGDVIIGAPLNDEGGADAGKVYVISIYDPQVGVGDPPVVPVLRFLPPWPNPARGSANLVFELDEEMPVTLEVFDSQGRLVDRPFRAEILAEGVTARVWRPGRLGNGVYYLRALLGERTEVRKLMWLGGR